MRLIVAIIIILLGIIAVIASEHASENGGMPITQVDYPMCVTVRPPVIAPPANPANIYPRRKDIA